MGKLEDFEIVQLKHDIPDFNVGDTVDVHVRIIEGDKQRIQIFTGTVISRRGTSNREAFTVRRIVAGEGVERVFPLHSPWIEEISVRRSGKVRRAKLYYLRDRIGKATKVRERMQHERKRYAKRKPIIIPEHLKPKPAAEASEAEAETAASS